MNRIFAMGRTTDTPETNVNDKKAKVKYARFTLAVNEYANGEQYVNYIPCVCFGKTAETVSEYFGKGIKILIEGSWRSGKYEDDKGNVHYTNECIVNRFDFCEKKG